MNAGSVCRGLSAFIRTLWRRVASAGVCVGLAMVVSLAIAAGAYAATAPVWQPPILTSLAAQTAELSAADGRISDVFGRAVAISGDTIVVGAPGDDDGQDRVDIDAGSVLVFVRSGGAWVVQADLAPTEPRLGGRFGQAVAVSGNTLLVGEPGGGDPAVGPGAAYAYVRSGSTWTLQQKLEADVPGISDYFGRSVALSGDTALVASSGTTCVFTRAGSVWTQQATLPHGTGAFGDEATRSLALSVDTAVISNTQDESLTGAAWVYTRSGGVWTEQQKLTASDAAQGEQFGTSVTLAGDTALVGDAVDTTAAGERAGSVYVYTRSAGVWSQRQKLTSSDAAEGDHFGWALSFSGNTAAIGAPFCDVGGLGDVGAVYLFTFSNGVWTQRQKLTLGSARVWDWYGFSVGLSGETVVAGTPRRWTAAAAEVGAVVVHQLPPARPAASSPKGAITAVRPTFRWQRVSSATSYEVRVYRGTTLVRKKTGTAGLSWRPSTPLPRGVYLTWKVRARNVAGFGPYSATLRFKIR